MSASGSLTSFGREHEGLSRVDEVRIADLILVPAVNDGVAQAVSVDAMADAPEIVASGDDGRVDLRNEHGPPVAGALGNLLGAGLTGGGGFLRRRWHRCLGKACGGDLRRHLVRNLGPALH